MASVTSNSFVNKKDIYVFKPNTPEFSCKFLLSIINSKLISFIKTKASTTAKKDDFTQLTLNDIRQLGIPVPNQQQKKRLEDLVDQIISIKKDDLKTNTNTLESEIDQLVYQLYGLTEDEIKIIEND